MALLSLKGPLVGRKGSFVGLKKVLIRLTQEDFKLRLSLAEREPLFNRNRAFLGPEKSPFRMIRGLPGQHKALSDQQRARLGRKRASVSYIGPFIG